MATEEVPFYPDLACHAAPLRPAYAPEPGCGCAVCHWTLRRLNNEVTLRNVIGPIRPGTPEWKALLEAAK